MKISNFRLVEVIRSGFFTAFRAIIDVTIKEGYFQDERTIQADIYKKHTGSWYFTENGKYVLSHNLDALERKLEAEKGKPLHECLDGDKS